MKRTVLWVVAATCLACAAEAEDGYELWLRYAPVADAGLRGHYLASVTGVRVEGSSETLRTRACYRLRFGSSNSFGCTRNCHAPSASCANAASTAIPGTAASRPST